MNIILVVFMILFSQYAFSSIRYENLIIDEPVFHYDDNAAVITNEILSNSYSIKSLKERLKSKVIAKDGSDYYFIPYIGFDLSSKRKRISPSIDNEGITNTLNFTVNSLLWSSSLSHLKKKDKLEIKKATSELESKMNDIYGVVYESLYNIDVSKIFLAKANIYEKRIKNLIIELTKTVESGIVTKSELLYTKVTLNKVYEKKSLTELNIKRYISDINNLAQYDIYNENSGMSYAEFDESFNVKNFNSKEIINNNADLKSARYKAEIQKYNSLSMNNMVSINLNAGGRIQTDYNTNKTTTRGTSYAYDDDGEAFIGLSISITGFDFLNKTKKYSGLKLYNSYIYDLDEKTRNTVNDINRYSFTYKNNFDVMSSLKTQIELTHQVIEKQFTELKIERINTIDIIRSISNLIDLEFSLLRARNEHVRINSSVMRLNSPVYIALSSHPE